MSSQHSSSSSHPLRPYYHPTPPEQQRHWLTSPSSSSLAAAASSSSSGTTSGSLQHLMASSSSAATRPRSSSYLLASRPTSVIPDYDLELTGSAEQSNLSPLLRGYLSAGMMAFTSAAMVMPFEVGKTLLQVQWIPAHDPISLPQPATEDYLEDDEEDDNLDTYFTQPKPPLRPSIGSTISKRTVSNATNGTRAASRTRQEGVEEEWPEWVLPVVVERGVADMIRAISRWRGEGFLGLWKGQLTAFIIDTVSSKVQPVLLATLFLLGSTPSAASLPLEHQAYPGLPLALSVGSYMATGLLLAPLDLVRTRLIVQSSQLRHRAYTGPIDALKTIIRTEGGLRNLFFHPALLLPALLDNLLRPLLHLATPLLIDRIFGLDRAQEPVRYGLAELGLSSAALLLVLPLETIRKRLQLQSHATPSSLPEASSSPAPPLKACVRLRPKPYNGMVEAFYRIITEEKAGFWGLFRGFNVGITANVVVFFLSILGNRPLADHPGAPFGSGGWAEV